ncbi:MAG: IgA Peptidase M64 [Gemmatimonadota bacterium]|nr:IgA Peptidase M64 [Gemmatimonadota bacterium]
MRLPTLATLTALVSVAPVVPLASAQQPVVFDAFFETRTMRLDYYHTGGVGSEIASLDQVVSDGPWAGSRTRLIDDTNLGPYRFVVRDARTGGTLYSRGFSSLYAEWESTPEARTMHRTFHESLRFPWPTGPVRVVVERRGLNGFQEVVAFAVDPAARSVNPAERPPMGTVWTLFEHGPPAAKVDLVLLGEGYTAAEQVKFHADATRLIERLFAYEPFRSRRQDFNVRAIDLPAAESGVSRPHQGQYRRATTGTQYSIFDSERYMLTHDNRTLRDVLSAAPYEFFVILVNEKQYGGGGIFNFQATTSVDSEFSDYVFVHEFAHHFAGLADEYYTSPVAYETGGAAHAEPWEPNVTALHDPARLKWGDLVPPGTPLPTAWDKARYETHARDIQARRRVLIESRAPEAEFDRLFREQRAVEREMLAGMAHAGVVGAFEGASYEARGLYRPEIDCIMFTRNMTRFCRVCQRAIARIIDLYAA